MSKDKYLQDVLDQEEVGDKSKEMKALRQERDNVEKILREKLSSKLSIRYGGSKAKGTMNKMSYDLDMTSYIGSGDNEVGETLKEIFDQHKKALSEDYYVEPKKSALRLKSKKAQTDLCIDVVPGRFVDEKKEDCYLYQNEGEKQRLKTNLSKHISHIRDSGYVPEIRLAKIWKTLGCVGAKTFILELLVVKILGDEKAKEGLSENMKLFYEKLYEKIETIVIVDPANPQGNDLSNILTTSVRLELKIEAEIALKRISEDRWVDIFGRIEKADDKTKTAAIISAPSSISNGAKLWGSEKF